MSRDYRRNSGNGTTFKSRRKRVDIDAVRKGKRISPKKASRMAAKRARLARLPKNHFKRFVWYLKHPKEIFKFWFSAEGGRFFLKILLGIFLSLAVIFLIFYVYVRIEMRSLSPEEIANRVQTTTVKYVDRNGKLLWEDTGTGNYRLVVDSEDISQYMKDATVAIEDKSFYEHGGVSITGIMRSLLNNLGGGSLQGGSTLTQQLVKQVYFYDESQASSGISQIPRKIKEVIIAMEAERIYSKDQILTMYLNESPYGGRRNGVESAAQTYFGKSAKELTIAESALLASIPQNPWVYNPYNYDYNTSLIERQHIVLKLMAEQGKITKEQAEKAKNVNILDKIKPYDTHMVGAKAPHFVQMVKSELENELGVNVMGRGGLTVKTTLDIRVQKIVDQEINKLFKSYLPGSMGFDNAAATILDSQTGQILAMRGSRDYNHPGYGAVNAATSFIQPGSSIKPMVYSALIDMNRDDVTYGGGSIIPDNPLPQSIYLTGNGGSLQNADGRFKGNIPLKQALAESRNVPAVLAMSYNGVDSTKEKIREMGDVSYCTDGVDVNAGLSSAIGGCGVLQVEHVNAFATLARMGKYRPYSSVIDVKDSNNNKIYEFDSEEGAKQVIDPQTAYIISDILSDAGARAGVFGYCPFGFCINGVKAAYKTGQSDMGGNTKDIWVMSYTPKATFGMWWGNNIPAVLNYGNSLSPGPYMEAIMRRIHTEVFLPDKTYTSNQWFSQPSGIQTIGGYLYPSWYKKSNIQITREQMTFDKVSKKVATSCTPAAAKIKLEVTKTYDQNTKMTTYTMPQGYEAAYKDGNIQYDDKHICRADGSPDYASPTVSSPVVSLVSGETDKYTVSVTVIKGSKSIKSVKISVGSQSNLSTSSSVPTLYETGVITLTPGSDVNIKVIIVDELFNQYVIPIPSVPVP